MRLSLNKKLYSEKAIKKTMHLFQENKVCDFSFSKKDMHYIILFKNIDKESKSIVLDKFCNFLITKEKKKNEK